MSNLRNKVQLIGNVGETPKITNLESGSTVARFSMATNAHYRNAKGEKVQSTQWHQVVAWDKRAEIIERYAGKGKQIAIEGRLISRSYLAESGERRYVTEIVAHEILLLGSKPEEAASKAENGETAKAEQKTENKTGKKSSRKAA